MSEIKKIQIDKISKIPSQLQPYFEELRGIKILDSWEVDDDPISIQVMLETLQTMSDDERDRLRVAWRGRSGQIPEWTDMADWECENREASSLMRQEFCAQIKKFGVDYPTELSYRERWQQCDFTSVTKTHVVINDIVVRRHESVIPLRSEVSDSIRHTRDLGIARDQSRPYYADLTYPVLSRLVDSSGLQYRPKINGERFLLVQKGVEWVLAGHKDIPVACDFGATVVEQYGNEFYIIMPIGAPSFVYRGITFQAHPFMDLESCVSKAVGHRFEGIMVYDQHMEYRMKFHPTIESLIGTEVWEVSETGPIRPRPGKYPQKDPEGFFRLLPPSSSVIRALRGVPSSDVIESPSLHCNEGSKVFLFNEKGVFFIRDKGKPWDLIGGALLKGETHFSGLCREFMEETGLSLPPSYYLGQTIDSSPGTQWISHVYLAYVPSIDLKMRGSLFRQSLLPIHGSQPWVRRHFEFVRGKIGPLELWMAQIVIRGTPVKCAFDSRFINDMSSSYARDLLDWCSFVFPVPLSVAHQRLRNSGFPFSVRCMETKGYLIKEGGDYIGSKLLSDECLPEGTALEKNFHVFLRNPRTRADLYLWGEEFGVAVSDLKVMMAPYKVPDSVYYHIPSE